MNVKDVQEGDERGEKNDEKGGEKEHNKGGSNVLVKLDG